MKINKLISYLKYIKNFIVNNISNRPIIKQEILLRQALIEEGIDLSTVKIECYHDIGLSKVNGIEFGIKYPMSFYKKAYSLTPKIKTVDFYFNGNTNESGKRNILLEPFKKNKNSIIISSNDGRKIKNKGKFNLEYFEPFALSKFGLCPHQMDWDLSLENMWTYRFIESCFVGAIPVLFKETPLGQNFIRNFYYEWNTDIIKNEFYEYNEKEAKKNRELSKLKFCFTNEEIKSIKNSIK